MVIKQVMQECMNIQKQQEIGQKYNDLVGEAQDDHFGHDVSLSADGKIVASGGRRNDGSASNAGNVMVFEYSNISWSQLR